MNETHALPRDLVSCIQAARDKKAEEILVMDVRGISDVTDFLVVCHGGSERQVQAIADAVEERVARQAGRDPSHVEGRSSGEWVLMDYFDFVVHIFVEEKRRFFALERLWGDAPRLDVPDEEPGEGRLSRAVVP